ncbi:hypothetical protein [Kribbella flavida]|uniref:hypothetical protein n=1 Tax=Kribbella flavida TaxID=182640 RepID=UPI00019BE808|nr:hypothetical protein [Kribbella flavida]
MAAATKFSTDFTACAADARAAAGGRAVMVHGGGAATSLLEAGELDEPKITWCRSCWVKAVACSSPEPAATSSCN